MYEWAEHNFMVAGGDCVVSARSDLTLCTVLGSCISACIHDPVAGIGGMNHYVLPTHGQEAANSRYGDIAMPQLLERLERAGASPRRLVAKLFGGAQVLSGEGEIGQSNIDFAETFLGQHRIPIVSRDVGGRKARWVSFEPATGESRVRRNPALGAPAPDPVFPVIHLSPLRDFARSK